MVFRCRVVATVLLLSVLGACGGGGEDAVGPTQATGKADDTARARTLVLQQSDMPAGWRGAAHTQTPLETERARDISTCLGRPDPDTFWSTRVYGADFTLGQ